MKQYILIIIFFILTTKIFSQKVDTELKYLKLVNSQSEELIKDNIRNAEIIAYKLIQNPDSYKNIGLVFFKELAKSYFNVKEYEFVLLTYYRQRCFFPDQVDAEVNKYYKNALEKIHKNNYKLLLSFYDETVAENIPKLYNKRFEMFLKLVYKSGFKNANEFENLYSDLYRKNTEKGKLPYWIKQQSFYSKIKVKPQKRKLYYSFEKAGNDMFIPDFLSVKSKKRICHKALKYFLHIKNNTKVKEYVLFCKENNIPYCLRAKFVK